MGLLLKFKDEIVEAVDPVKVRLKILKEFFCILGGLKELHKMK